MGGYPVSREVWIDALGTATGRLHDYADRLPPVVQARNITVTGEARAFFDFRFVWQVIRARLTGHNQPQHIMQSIFRPAARREDTES